MKTNAYKIDTEVSSSIFLDSITSSIKCKTTNTLLVSSLWIFSNLFVIFKNICIDFLT